MRIATLTLAGAAVACAAEPPIASPPVPDLGVQRRAGTTLLQTKAFYGIPILQKSFAWDGNGETDDAGLGLHAAHFVTDDVALGGGINAATWLTPGANVYSGEVEGLLRYYPYHGPFFVDLTAGFQQATGNIPPGGTEWNFSFSFGPGVDVPIARGCSLELGATYHHISNALGRDNDRNPSQNEARLWVGFAWTL